MDGREPREALREKGERKERLWTETVNGPLFPVLRDTVSAVQRAKGTHLEANG